MFRVRVLLTALAAVVLASCSLSVQDDAKGSTTTAKGDDAASSSTPARDFSDVATHGVTDDKITVGAAIIDTAKVKEKYGVELGGVPAGTMEALVEAQNERGGINGRQIEFVPKYFLPIGNEDSERVCRELTEDDPVFLVIGTFLSDNALCVTETHSTPYTSWFGLTQERMDRSKAPYLTTAPMVDDELAQDMDVLVDSGEIDKSKVAVYWEGDLKSDWVETNIIERLKKGGIDVVSTAQLPSSGDQVQADADVTRILQRFQADGADTLINLAGQPVILPALGKSTYRPRMIFTNGQILGEGVLEKNKITDRDNFADALTVLSGSTSEEVAADPAFKRCLDDINSNSELDIKADDLFSKDIKPSSRGYGQLGSMCKVWQFTVDVLEAAGDDPTVQSLNQGLADAKLDYVGSKGAHVSPTRWGAGEAPRLWRYDVERDGFLPAESSGSTSSTETTGG